MSANCAVPDKKYGADRDNKGTWFCLLFCRPNTCNYRVCDATNFV